MSMASSSAVKRVYESRLPDDLAGRDAAVLRGDAGPDGADDANVADVGGDGRARTPPPDGADMGMVGGSPLDSVDARGGE